MAKKLIFSTKARRELQKGVDIVAKAVGTTLGPKGRNIALERDWGPPSVVHDGVSIAEEIELSNKYQDIGVQLVKEAAKKTNDSSGDGTTTATVLAQAIISEGMKNLTAGVNPMILNKGIEKASKQVIDYIIKQTQPLKDNFEKIEQIATISAQNKQIGRLIAKAIKEVGNDGVITPEEGKGTEIEVSYKKGMEFNRGYISPYFVTNTSTMEAVIETPFILITNEKIDSLPQIMPILEKVLKVSKNLLIIAEDVMGDALAMLISNKLRGKINCVTVKAPDIGERRDNVLEDIALLTGGVFVNTVLGQKVEELGVEGLGQANSVLVTKDSTVIVGGRGDKALLKKRMESLREQIKEETRKFELKVLKGRLAKLSGGVAVIEVGAATEVEMKEKQERVKDAIGATKAAIEEGIVPGGGIILLKASKVIKTDGMSPEEVIGANIVKLALERPVRLLVENAGYKGDVIVNEIEKKEDGIGFDVLSGKYVDMIEEGIIDPVKVTKSAFKNAVSVAIMILTTEGLVVKEKEKDGGQMPTPGI